MTILQNTNQYLRYTYMYMVKNTYTHMHITNFTKHSPFFRSCLLISWSWNSPPFTQYYHLPNSPPLKPTLSQLHLLCTQKHFAFKYILSVFFSHLLLTLFSSDISTIYVYASLIFPTHTICQTDVIYIANWLNWFNTMDDNKLAKIFLSTSQRDTNIQKNHSKYSKKYQASKQRPGFYPLVCNTEKQWYLFSYNKTKLSLLQNLPRICMFFNMLVFIIFIICILSFLSKNIYCS